jgi:hypothetical protein
MGVSQGVAFSGQDLSEYMPAVYFNTNQSATVVLNAGQRAFSHPLSGYKSLNTANLSSTIADGSKYFEAKKYNGNSGTAQTISGFNFSPDFIWYKHRSGASSHGLHDIVRGTGKYLSSNSTGAELSLSTVTAFNSDGFSLGTDGGANGSGTFIAWAWDAGSSNTTIAAGGLNSSVYDQSQNWTSGWVSEATYNNGDTFDGILGANGQGGSNYLVWSPPSAVSYSDALGGVEVYTSTNNAGYNNWAYKVNPTSTSYSASAPSDLSSFISPYEINSGVQSGWTKISTGDGSLTSVGMWNKYATESGIHMNGLKVNGKILVDSGVTPPNFPSIASTVRANPSAGVSIVTYSGNETGATVGHGLNAPLQMIWIKQRTNHSTTGKGDGNWIVGHTGVGMGSGRLILNGTYTDDNGSGAAQHWNSTAATSSVFSVGTSGNVNGSNNATYVAYCFAPIEGYSAAFSWSGNGTDNGSFIYLGFRPKFVIMKDINASNNWQMLDAARDPFNVTVARLFPNQSVVENTATSNFDFLSNGLKARNQYTTSLANTNFIGFAFAEHPFKTARAR